MDVFVAETDPQVRRDSENDCDDIIRDGKTFINYMAVDNKVVNGVKSPDHPVLLLTNVFRVIVDGQAYPNSNWIGPISMMFIIPCFPVTDIAYMNFLFSSACIFC